MKRLLRGEDATIDLAKRLAPFAGRLSTIFLRGDLGAGKTTFVRALLRAMGYSGAVKSPTFTIVEPYEIAGRPVYHFDLYRLADPGELEFLGFEDYLSPGSLCLIEWPDRGAGMLPVPDIEIAFFHAAKGRAVEVSIRKGIQLNTWLSAQSGTAQ